MKKKIKKVIVWGTEYTNVVANIENGKCVGGYIKGVGEFAEDSMVTAVINGQKDIGSVEA